MEKVTLSAAIVRRLIKAAVRDGTDAGLAELSVDPNEPIEVWAAQPVAVGLTLLTPSSDGGANLPEGVKNLPDTITVTEPKLGCNDTVIVSPTNEFGASLVSQFGNVWKITGGRSNKGDTVPHTWLLNNVPAKVAGKFAGHNKKNITQEYMPVDQSDPSRWAKVVFVCKFPEEFKWRVYFDSLKVKGITIAHLNNVDFEKVAGRIAKKDGEQIAEAQSRSEQDASKGPQDQSEA